MPDTRATSSYLNRPCRPLSEVEAAQSLTRREMSVLRSIRTGRGLGVYTLNACEISTGYDQQTFYALLRSLRDKGMIDTWQGDSGVCVKMQPAGFLASAPE